MADNLPLHVGHVIKSSLIINRLHTLFHGIAIISLIYYRFSSINNASKTKGVASNLPSILIFISELILSFIWILNQPFRYRPVKQTVFPERLPEDDELPAIDVFICTIDPSKEPSVEVMNTVISAMSMDYPAGKINVYVSDDGGSPLTLFAMKEAWKFARLWLPFCKRNELKVRCPAAYFAGSKDFTGSFGLTDFVLEEADIKKHYESFKDRVHEFQDKNGAKTSNDHPPIIEVITDAAIDGWNAGERDTPNSIIYVSREKRPSHSHHFKAGALNVLLRVSGMTSNSPYILILDCDMYCNDPSSARQAMCFHLDAKISNKLAFVQFPQKFHNISKNDIYDSEIRSYFMLFNGFNGLKGPPICGTNLYIKREALYGPPNEERDVDLHQLQKRFGSSIEFVASVYKQNNKKILATHRKETQHLASCTYEKHSEWGKEVGFRYVSLVEDYFTGFMLCCIGWSSVYLDPPKPAFLGSATTNLSDFLVQNTRWCIGAGQITISKYTPLLYGASRMSILQSMCYAEFGYRPFYCLPLWCLALVPQLCLLRGVSVYPAVSSPTGMVFGFLFLSSILKDMQEVHFAGYSYRTWLNDQRIWMIKSVTCWSYGTLYAILEKIGTTEASFLPTNKVAVEEQTQRYQMGIFDFQASPVFIAPICMIVILNMVALIIGGAKMVNEKNCDAMFIQVFISVFILLMQYPVIEGMIIRKDNGRVAPWVTILSAALALVVLLIVYTVSMV